jgi:hypothetical protein
MDELNLSVKFIRVRMKDDHIVALYNLLKSRVFNISNECLPSFGEHKDFVINNPYRAWYLIEKNECFVGSIYLMKNNSVGIQAVNQDEDIIRSAIYWVIKNKKPLPAIKSVRAPFFHINLSPNNTVLSAILKEMQYETIQITFSLEHRKI